jgi:hypothetical protein
MRKNPEIVRVRHANARLRATIAAMWEMAREMEIAPAGLDNAFYFYKDGKVYAAPPDRVEGIFTALKNRWEQVADSWVREMRWAREKVFGLESEVKLLREENASLRVACMLAGVEGKRK